MTLSYPILLKNPHHTAHSYKELEEDSTVEDICDFIVEYIHSDVLVRRSQVF